MLDEFLGQYRWKARLLLAFAPGEGDPSLVQQRHILADAEAVAAERDLVLIEVVGDAVHPGGAGAAAGLGTALRRRFAAPGNYFQAVLVGKDGGIKLIATEPVTADRLAATIDAMPMRRREGASLEDRGR